MRSMTDDMAAVMAALAGGRAHEDALRAALGGCDERLQAALAELHAHVKATRVKIPSVAGFHWVDCDAIVARCPWTPEQALAAIKAKPYSSRELAVVAQCEVESMRLLLRRMERDQLIKTKAFHGHRRWIPFTQKVAHGGSRTPVRPQRLLTLIAKHQPVRLELLVELTGRGRLYLRERVHKLRRAGKVEILGVDGSWLYVLAGYERSPQDIERDILLRCEDVGGDCLKWSGAKNKQGRPVMRHDGNTRRVDMVLWTAVRGKPLRNGYALVQTCETPGCCNHEHHKAVTRGEAMKQAFATIGFGGDKHGRRVSEAIRHKVGSLSADEVALIHASPLSGAELARQLGKTKSVVSSVRAGKAYRDYSRPTSPFAGLGARA